MTTLTIPQPRTAATTICSFFDAWAAGDVSGLEDLVDEDVVVSPLLGLLFEREAYVGRTGVAAAFGETAGRWHELELTVEDVTEIGGRLVASIHMVAGRHGMSSELELRVACELHDGVITTLVDDEL
jgi:ketosteroid isomerase-like protein